MKQDDIITINIEALGSDASGISHYGEYTVFTPYVLPEEEVLAKVTYVKRNIAYAKPLEILRKSVHRVQPRCPVFGKCGGCKLQHMDYETQVQFKTQQFVSCMNKIGNIEINPLSAVASEREYFYRNKLVLPVTQYKGKIQMGFYKDRSHDIVPIEECPLHDSWNKILIDCIKQYMQSAGERGYDHSSDKGKGDIRHLCARYIEGQLLVILVTNNPRGIKDPDRLYSIVRKQFPQCGIFQSVNTGNTNVVLGTEVLHLRGIKNIQAKAFGISFTLRPESFFQVNPFIFTRLYADVKSHVEDTEILIDAYSGTGVLTAALSSDKYDTFGVEINPSATKDADETARLNLTQRQTNLNGDAKVLIPELFERFRDKKITLVVDPVRKGLDESTSRLIAELAPEKFIYVSCNPATQARDLAIITANQPAYRIVYARVYDQFPQTVSSESIVCLSREKANAPSHNFRIAQQDDAEHVLSLYQSAKSSAFCVWNDSYPTIAEIEHDLETKNLYVMTDGSKVIGAVSVVPENELDEFDCWSCKDSKEIARVVIDKAYQGYGLSFEMIQGIAPILRKKGCKAIHLSVVKTNVPAYKTYIKAGFAVVGEAQMYGNDYYLMEKVIDTKFPPERMTDESIVVPEKS